MTRPAAGQPPPPAEVEEGFFGVAFFLGPATGEGGILPALPLPPVPPFLASLRRERPIGVEVAVPVA